jgi:hypothetical protein
MYIEDETTKFVSQERHPIQLYFADSISPQLIWTESLQNPRKFLHCQHLLLHLVFFQNDLQ